MVEDEISFGRFRLDLARRELRRDETLVRLGSRALDILSVLASAGGKVVSKDELMERVWAGVVVEEHNIQVHISALRKALAEDRDAESWIVTVPGRGYRLVRAPEPPAVDNAAAEPSAPISRAAVAGGAAVPQYERRSRAGVFRRRHGRGDHHRPRPHPLAFRRRPQFELRL